MDEELRGAAQPQLLREMNATGAGLFLAGGVLVVAVLLITDWQGVSRGWLTVFGVNALVAGAVLLAAARTRPFPPRVLSVLAVAGTANITGTVLASGAQGSGAFGALYVFVSAYSFYYFPFRTAVTQVALTAIAYAVAVSIVPVPDPASQWLVITGTSVIVGALLGRLGHRERTLLHEELTVTSRLRELDDLKTAFLRAVSHELRTPLTALVGYTQTLQERGGDLDEAQTAVLLERTVANAERLHRLLGDLLDIDRVSRGVVQPHLTPTDVGALVREVAADLSPDSHPLTVDVEPITVPAETSKIERIVENLLANAIRHTPAGTPVWARVERDPSGCLVTVEDAGPGVPDDLKGPLFEPFAQGPDAAINPKPGTGIGLSLVARFTELHGGRAWVEDRPGGGAAFKVLLPDSPAGSGQ